MSDLIDLVSQHMEVPKELILEIKEYPENGTINAILGDFSKHTLTLEQITKTAVPILTDITGLGRTSNDRLEEAGITTIKAMLAKTPEEIAEITKQKPEIVVGWFKQAQTLII